MTAETWASIITTVVVPILLRILVHYFPWLADAVVPGTGEAVKPGQHRHTGPAEPHGPDELREGS